MANKQNDLFFWISSPQKYAEKTLNIYFSHARSSLSSILANPQTFIGSLMETNF